MRRPVQFGKYLLLGRISVGGMAEVFKAKSFGVQGFEKIIAIKRILPALCRDEEFISMFIDEAKIAGQLAHGNIGKIHELGQVDGAHFIAMEYIWGRDLLQLQNRFKKRGQRIAPAAASFIVMKVCEGLNYAHRKRDVLGVEMEIVHRDCSPQNVVLSFEGEVKLIDFGIARAASRQSRTNAGVLKGKFGYMSPEQVRGLPLDRRTDIFSLGIILFETLTGKRLFDGESDFATLEKVRHVEIDHQALAEAKVPEQLKSVVLKALERSPEERYQWCSEMRDDLLAYLQSAEEAYSYRSLGEEVRAAFTEELVHEKELMDIYTQIGPEGLPPGDESAEKLVSLELLDLGESSDEHALDSLDLIENLGSQRVVVSGGEGDFEDNPTEIFGEIEMKQVIAALSSDPQSPVDAKVQIEDQQKPIESPATSSLVASLPTLEGGQRTSSVILPIMPSTASAHPASSNVSRPAYPTYAMEAPSTGVRAVSGRSSSGRSSSGRSSRNTLLVSVSAVLVVALGLVALRGVFFGGSASGAAPQATLVVMVSDRESAEVFLGNDRVGMVPAGDALTVEAIEPGEYEIRVERPGVRGCQETISVSANKAKVFSCDFVAPKQGTLVMEGLLVDDVVRIDGKALPSAALAAPIPLLVGSAYTITVSRAGRVLDEFTVTPKADIEVRHTIVTAPEIDAGVAEPKEKRAHSARGDRPQAPGRPPQTKDDTGNDEDGPAEGSLAAKKDDPKKDDPQEPGYLVPWTRPWARVYIDGKDTGKVTPVATSAKIKLSPGSHQVTFVVGSKKHHFQVIIASGKTTKLSKLLDP